MMGNTTPMQILLADDGSEHAQAAIDFLCHLPHGLQYSITVLTVFSPQRISHHNDLQTRLESTRQLLATHDYQVETALQAGSPAETITNYANQIHPHLIIVGAKGLRATLGILLGGVAQQIVEYASYPVLVVRAPFHGLRRVLLITDGSSCSQRALEYAIQFPFPAQTAIHVMHVLPPITNIQTWPAAGLEILPPLPVTGQTDEMLTWQIEEEKRGKAILEKTTASLQNTGRLITPILRRGDAATEIIDYVKNRQIDLIVAGARGLSQIQSWLLGSLTRKLIHYAGCSVLVVKG